jgi:hypothetical protein
LANLDGHVVDDALRRNAIQQFHGMREFDKVYQRLHKRTNRAKRAKKKDNLDLGSVAF